MTIENWINIAMIIAVIMTAAATLLGPVLGSYIQVRMSQPKPAPEETQPKAAAKERRLLRWFRIIFSAYIWVPISIAMVLWGYYQPLDHKAVLFIAMGCAGVAGYVSHDMHFDTLDILRIQRDVMAQHQQMIHHLYKHLPPSDTDLPN